MAKQLPFPIEKLAELLILAREEGVTLTPVRRNKIDMIATRPGSSGRYLVNGEFCSCPAYMYAENPCKHRALWIYEHLADYAQDVLYQASPEIAKTKKHA